MSRIITHTFRFSILERFVEVFDGQRDIFISKLEPLADGQTVVNIFESMGLLILDSIAESAIGVTINADMNSRLEFVQTVKDVTETIATRFVRLHLTFPKLLKIFAPNLHRTQMKGILIMQDFTENTIAERSQYIFDTTLLAIPESESETASQPNDISNQVGIKPLLDVLMRSIMDDGLPLMVKPMRDEVNTFRFGGHDITTAVISHCSANQQKVFEELQQQFGNNDVEHPLTYKDLCHTGNSAAISACGSNWKRI